MLKISTELGPNSFCFSKQKKSKAIFDYVVTKTSHQTSKSSLPCPSTQYATLMHCPLNQVSVLRSFHGTLDDSMHRNKKCKEVATKEFLKGRLVLLLEIERPLSISHVFSKQSVFFFYSCLNCFSLLWCYILFLTHSFLPFLPVFAGEISLCHVFLFWLFFGRCMVSSVAPSLLFIFRWFYVNIKALALKVGKRDLRKPARWSCSCMSWVMQLFLPSFFLCM